MPARLLALAESGNYLFGIVAGFSLCRYGRGRTRCRLFWYSSAFGLRIHGDDAKGARILPPQPNARRGGFGREICA